MPLKKEDLARCKFKNLSFELEDVKEDSASNVARVVGLSAGFNNLDSYAEIITPGAFEKTIKATMNWPVLRFHDPSRKIGFNEHAEEVKKGLRTISLISLDTQDGREQMALTKLALDMDKAKDAQSIGFMPKVWEHDDSKDQRITYLKEIEMWEHSFVTWGANDRAYSTGLKNWEPNKESGFGLGDYIDQFVTFIEALGYDHVEVMSALKAKNSEELDNISPKLIELMDQSINVFKKV